MTSTRDPPSQECHFRNTSPCALQWHRIPIAGFIDRCYNACGRCKAVPLFRLLFAEARLAQRRYCSSLLGANWVHGGVNKHQVTWWGTNPACAEILSPRIATSYPTPITTTLFTRTTRVLDICWLDLGFGANAGLAASLRYAETMSRQCPKGRRMIDARQSDTQSD